MGGLLALHTPITDAAMYPSCGLLSTPAVTWLNTLSNPTDGVLKFSTATRNFLELNFFFGRRFKIFNGYDGFSLN